MKGSCIPMILNLDNGVAESVRLKNEFLATITTDQKDALLNKCSVQSATAETFWKKFGHTPQWVNAPSIETNRTINYPRDTSVYARRDACCLCCGYDMWLIVESSSVTIHQGQHQCEPKQG